MALPHWLTREEAADYARVSLRKLQHWISDGDLRSSKLGARRLIRRADLDAFLAGEAMPVDGEGDTPPPGWKPGSETGGEE